MNVKPSSIVEAKVQQCQNEIVNILHNPINAPIGAHVVTAAHLLSIAAQYNYPFGVPFDMVLDESAKMGLYPEDVAIRNCLANSWEDLKALCNYYGVEDFKKAAALSMPVTDKRDEPETPESIAKLAIKILHLRKDDHAADLCCGKGSVMLEMHQACPSADISGYEINPLAANIAGIRAYASDSNIYVKTCDVFDLPGEDVHFDKIFSNYPFGMNLRQLGTGQRYLEQIAYNVPTIRKATSSDWVFNCLIMDLLNHDGRAVAIMTNGSTWNTIDADTRKYFVEQGFIECVIALPAKLFSSTNIPTTMIVLSHGNDSVHMVDASDLCVKGRRQNLITDELVERIYEACHNESGISKTVTSNEIAANDYMLNPGRYFLQVETVDNGVPFESVIKNISRGAHCSAEQLDAMDSKEPTNMQFLKTSDIQDGLITGPLQYLSYIEGNFEKYCIKDRNLIISKVGAPSYKVAVASVAENHKLLANANLYVVELDESKVDPYYLKAYLESAEGQSRFRNIAAGTVVLSIGIKDLKNMMIPLPPLEEQQRIAARYMEAMDEVLRLKIQLQEATERMNRIFEESIR